jgi:amino acid transporter
MALVNFPWLNTVLERSGTSWLVGVGMVLLFAVTNALGIRVYGRLEIVLTLGMWTTLMIFGIADLLHTPAVTLDGLFGASSIGTGTPAVLSLVGMAMFMFVGFEFVTPLAAELRKPAKMTSASAMWPPGRVCRRARRTISTTISPTCMRVCWSCCSRS